MTSRILFICSLLFFNLNTWGQKEDYGVISNWLEYSDNSNSLYHELSNQAYTQLQDREKAIQELKTLSEWQERQKFVRKSLLEIVGPFPEKTPLNPKITGRIEKDDYVIEKIIFESQPGFYVTSSLFLPKNRKGKLPAIVYFSGHSNEGYKIPVYQHVILNLVKKGFIVFAFDPIGQGERLGYYDLQVENPSEFGVNPKGTNHSYSGVQAFITGSSQARYVIWDGIRAIDYLLTRKEVDPQRLGVTGRSGGGTQSAYIGAIDERVLAVAPENYITNFKRLIQSKGPQDAEQNLYNQLLKGIDEPDYIEVRAPKPTLLITTSRDIFSPQGVRETINEASKVYRAYGRPDNLKMVMDDSVHASTPKNRESMYAFFQKHLNNPGDSADLDVKILTNDELQVTKTGQVLTSYANAETVYSLNKKEAEYKIKNLHRLRQNLSTHLKDAVKAAEELSGYKKEGDHEPVFTGRYKKSNYAIEKYFVKGNGNYRIPYLVLRPDRPNGKAVLLLNPKGKSDEVNRKEVFEFLNNGFTLMIPDLIGIGEAGPGKFYDISNRYFGFFSFSVIVGRSIVGMQTGDVQQLVSLLKNNYKAEEVFGIAYEEMTPILLHAAAFDKRIERILLVNPLSSYRSLVTNRVYKPSLIYGAVAGAIGAYDLPDLAASLAPRELTIVNSVDEKGERIIDNSYEEDFSVIRSAYKNTGAKLRIVNTNQESGAILEEWIAKNIK